MSKTCEICREPMASQRAAARYCSGRCRARAHRAGVSRPRNPKAAAAKAAAKAAKPTPEPRPVIGLLEAVRAELDAAKVTDTAAGQHALELATRIVNATALNTGVAAMSKQLQSVMAEALGPAENTAAPVNPLDELKARRDRKRATH